MCYFILVVKLKKEEEKLGYIYPSSYPDAECIHPRLRLDICRE